MLPNFERDREIRRRQIDQSLRLSSGEREEIVRDLGPNLRDRILNRSFDYNSPDEIRNPKGFRSRMEKSEGREMATSELAMNYIIGVIIPKLNAGTGSIMMQPERGSQIATALMDDTAKAIQRTIAPLSLAWRAKNLGPETLARTRGRRNMEIKEQTGILSNLVSLLEEDDSKGLRFVSESANQVQGIRNRFPLPPEIQMVHRAREFTIFGTELAVEVYQKLLQFFEELPRDDSVKAIEELTLEVPTHIGTSREVLEGRGVTEEDVLEVLKTVPKMTHDDMMVVIRGKDFQLYKDDLNVQFFRTLGRNLTNSEVAATFITTAITDEMGELATLASRSGNLAAGHFYIDAGNTMKGLLLPLLSIQEPRSRNTSKEVQELVEEAEPLLVEDNGRGVVWLKENVKRILGQESRLTKGRTLPAIAIKEYVKIGADFAIQAYEAIINKLDASEQTQEQDYNFVPFLDMDLSTGEKQRYMARSLHFFAVSTSLLSQGKTREFMAKEEKKIERSFGALVDYIRAHPEEIKKKVTNYQKNRATLPRTVSDFIQDRIGFGLLKESFRQAQKGNATDAFTLNCAHVLMFAVLTKVGEAETIALRGDERHIKAAVEDTPLSHESTGVEFIANKRMEAEESLKFLREDGTGITLITEAAKNMRGEKNRLKHWSVNVRMKSFSPELLRIVSTAVEKLYKEVYQSAVES